MKISSKKQKELSFQKNFRCFEKEMSIEDLKTDMIRLTCELENAADEEDREKVKRK